MSINNKTTRTRQKNTQEPCVLCHHLPKNNTSRNTPPYRTLCLCLETTKILFQVLQISEVTQDILLPTSNSSPIFSQKPQIPINTCAERVEGIGNGRRETVSCHFYNVERREAGNEKQEEPGQQCFLKTELSTFLLCSYIFLILLDYS